MIYASPLRQNSPLTELGLDRQGQKLKATDKDFSTLHSIIAAVDVAAVVVVVGVVVVIVVVGIVVDVIWKNSFWRKKKIVLNNKGVNFLFSWDNQYIFAL